MKRVILFLAFIFPISIFIFLRYFGKNEFTIPVYYEEGVDSFPDGCTVNPTTPYQVSDVTLNSLGWNGSVVLIVSDTTSEAQRNLSKMIDDSGLDKLQLIIHSDADSVFGKFCRCDLLLEKPWTAVLLDEQRRIRGYYAPNSREELDRLSVEIKILLNKY
jgi:hypothetical protein